MSDRDKWTGDFIDAVVLDPTRAAEMLQRRPDLRNARWTLGESVMHFLAIEGKAEHVRLLGEWKFDPDITNEFGDTALIDAATLGRNDIVAVLLDLGANPNARSATRGNPLRCAVSKGNSEMVELLISKGADLKPVSESSFDNLLKIAIETGSAATIDVLLNAGIERYDVDDLEETVFDAMYRARGDCQQAVEEVLRRHGFRQPWETGT